MLIPNMFLKKELSSKNNNIKNGNRKSEIGKRERREVYQ